MTKIIKAKYLPTEPELREFYLCGIRTGYDSVKSAEKEAKHWANHTSYNCEYCPGVHHVNGEALLSSERLNSLAIEHWNKFNVKLEEYKFSSQ